jgi:non-ribosomal peptide synthetase component E (peptide arylation enzyme)
VGGIACDGKLLQGVDTRVLLCDAPDDTVTEANALRQRLAREGVGELLVHNATTAREYISNDAAVNEQKFVDIDDVRFFRTGDWVRLQGGNVEILGRVGEYVMSRAQV